jgi:transcription-repair coupling factor (superfamily II helicase)
VRDDWLMNKEGSCSLEELLRLVKKAWEHGEELAISPLEGGSKGFFISLLARVVIPLLVITPDQDQAEALWQAILFFTPVEEQERVLLFPTDGIPHGDIPPWDIISQRMKVLRALAEERASVVIAPIQGLQREVPLRKTLLATIIRIEQGREQAREALVRAIIALGYTRVEMVEERGEMSLRGGIMDIYPVDQDAPLRMEFFGDQVESIRLFDIETQQSQAQVEEAVITPVMAEGEGTLFDYLPAETRMLIDNPTEAEHEAAQFWEHLQRHGKEEGYLAPDRLAAMIRERPRLEIGGWETALPKGRVPSRATLLASSNEDLSRRIKAEGLKVLIQEIQGWLNKGWAIYVTAQTPGQGKRLVELLEDFKLKAGLRDSFPLHPLTERGRLAVVIGDLKAGFLLPSEGLAIVTEEEIFGLKRRVGHGRRAESAPLSTFEDLRHGDHVVHVDYGIGLFRGLEGEGVEND